MPFFCIVVDLSHALMCSLLYIYVIANNSYIVGDTFVFTYASVPLLMLLGVIHFYILIKVCLFNLLFGE